MESSKPLPPYRYRPLEASSDSIRLLLLDPATIEDETLCGSLVIRSLSSFEDDLNTHYAALSYVWGDPSRTKSIELVDGGKRFRHGLAANLHEALRNIREENRAIWIWADAICIDQNNISERGQQVKLMGDIYRGAGCTVIYLGHLNSEIELLFEATNYQPVPEQIDQLKRAAEDLCSREWFKRGWVFQELVLSHNPRVQCGRYRLGWEQLYSAIQHYLPSPSAGDMLRTMNTARNDHESRTFAQLVIARKGARVNDPRDYFFCLMGIASDSDTVQRFLPVDYRLGARDIFTKAAQLIANDEHSTRTTLVCADLGCFESGKYVS
ncbi:hypothetical protein KJ359_001884 [Pestalotiopsis sp. 9143b]|nr:hypothetical protein KJ359_001884 [Pestalotiopsis sp. 9143b]